MVILELSSLFHLTLGVGNPVALQVNVSLDPSLTITSLLLKESSILGGTANNTKTDRYIAKVPIVCFHWHIKYLWEYQVGLRKFSHREIWFYFCWPTSMNCCVNGEYQLLNCNKSYYLRPDQWLKADSELIANLKNDLCPYNNKLLAKSTYILKTKANISNLFEVTENFIRCIWC